MVLQEQLFLFSNGNNSSLTISRDLCAETDNLLLETELVASDDNTS